jgi:hypothetical protein
MHFATGASYASSFMCLFEYSLHLEFIDTVVVDKDLKNLARNSNCLIRPLYFSAN